MKINLNQAHSLLQEGKVVALPTETVYGLAANLNRPEAIQKIFTLKGRPATNPLIIHIGHFESITDYTSHLPPRFFDLAEYFWPGPLTLILPIHTALVPEIARAGLPTAGFRIPKHPLTLELLKSSSPIVMPSANLSGKPSATHPEHVENDFGVDFPIVDGGVCSKGLESTILYYSHDLWKIGRLGAIPAEQFHPILGYYPKLDTPSRSDHQPFCPGQLFKHYSPQARLLKKEEEKNLAEVILGFKERNYELKEFQRVIELGSLSNPHQVAQNLFMILRRLDTEKVVSAWVDMDFPDNELWMTINERLSRAMAAEG